MRCHHCGGFPLFEQVIDTMESLIYDQYKCVNCARAVMGPLQARVPVPPRPLEPVGRWAHRR